MHPKFLNDISVNIHKSYVMKKSNKRKIIKYKINLKRQNLQPASRTWRYISTEDFPPNCRPVR
jgi:hypothetical protein